MVAPPRPLSAQALRKLAGTVERRAARTLRGVLARVRAGLPLAELERAILARNVDQAIEAIGLEPVVNALHQVQTSTAPIRTTAWDAALDELPRTIQRQPLVALSFEAAAADRPEVMDAIRRQDLRRIQDIRRETEQAIRDTLVRGLETGTPPRELARAIRPVIGLNRRQAAALEAFRRRLEAEDLDPATIERRVERQSQRGVALRAENIAITETFQAINDGKRAQWQRLVASGDLQSNQWEQEWITADDERTCPQCAPFHGERAPIGGTFTAGSDLSSGPPLHPRCRCIARLVLKGFRAGETKRRRPIPLGIRPGPAKPPKAPTPAPAVPGPHQTGATETPEHQRARIAFETEHRSAAIETAYSQLADGSILQHSSGAPAYVQFSTAQRQRLLDAELFTHNHPQGTPLSPGDIDFAAGHRVKWLRAVGIEPDGTPVTWETNVGQVHPGRTNLGEIGERFYAQLFPKYKAQYDALIAQGVEPAHASRVTTIRHWTETWQKVADAHSFSIRRIA